MHRSRSKINEFTGFCCIPNINAVVSWGDAKGRRGEWFRHTELIEGVVEVENTIATSKLYFIFEWRTILERWDRERGFVRLRS